MRLSHAYTSAALCVMLGLTGCASSKTSDSTVEDTGVATAPPAGPLSQGPWTASNISRTLSGHTFGYVNGGSSGQVTYNSDFTFSYQEQGKGQGTGIWQPTDNALCEAFDPTSALPKGTPSRCLPFSTVGDAYAVGGKRLRPV